jgi:hypothetical protein
MCLSDDCTEKLLFLVISYAACSNVRCLGSADLWLKSVKWHVIPTWRDRKTHRAGFEGETALWSGESEKKEGVTTCKVNEVRNFICCQTRFVK